MTKFLRLGNVIIGSVLLTAFLYCCTQAQNKKKTTTNKERSFDNNLIINGNTVATRFETPPGFFRTKHLHDFAHYLQQLPLKPTGTKVQYYDGSFKTNAVQAAVVDVSVGNKDLQQCADAIIRLRADYFYEKNQFDSISFKLTNGFAVPFSKWIKGFRVSVNGNNCTWILSSTENSGKSSYQKYLEFIFSYAGTLSLSKGLHSKYIEQIDIGDVFIRGGSPGHAIIVVDMAMNKDGEKIFLLAQSYMPAQDIHILINLEDAENSPWYKFPSGNLLKTPEWRFSTSELKTW